MAQYQLKELGEAQEVAEVTRPHRADMLKAFESSYLVPLGKSIVAKDMESFSKAFMATEQACNACHTALGYAYIQVHVAEAPAPGILDFSLKTDPQQ